MLDEVEQGRLRPMDVVDDEDDRSIDRDPFDQPAERPEQLLPASPTGLEPEDLGQPASDQPVLGRLRQQGIEPAAGGGRVVGLLDPGHGPDDPASGQ